MMNHTQDDLRQMSDRDPFGHISSDDILVGIEIPKELYNYILSKYIDGEELLYKLRTVLDVAINVLYAEFQEIYDSPYITNYLEGATRSNTPVVLAESIVIEDKHPDKRIIYTIIPLNCYNKLKKVCSFEEEHFPSGFTRALSLYFKGEQH